ncbi:MAG: DNA internalization-related competence protein ComEC/Rec2 [Butyrivibrio sp.]|nr:DNA internalization-related competence protein ComEC/Rec2 [Butyrivibrio sp.]
MKRPLFIVSIVITAIVFLYLRFFLSDYLTCYPDSIDGSFFEICGYVTDKETKPGFAGEEIPIVYITPANASIGKSEYIQLYMDTEHYNEPRIGELIKASGKVRLFSGARNPGEFDSSLYYRSLKIAYSMRNVKISYRDGKVNYLHEGLYRLRSFLKAVLDKCLSDKDAAIMKALLLGDKTCMDQEIKELYKNSGIIHVLAVSGLHISLIGMGIFRILRKLKLKVMPASIASIILMYMYGLLCGMSSSAFRAIIMFSLRMIAPLLKRTADMLSSMAFAELMLLIDEPLLLYNSGFLFSFGAIIGIGLVYSALTFDHGKRSDEKMRFVDDKKDPFYVTLAHKIGESIKISVSVFLVTLPVYMTFYYTYPIYSIFLNLIILPLVAPLMLMGIGLIAAGSIAPVLGRIIGIGVSVILRSFEFLCGFQGEIPGRTWYMGHAKEGEIILYIIALLIFCFLPEINKKKEKLYIDRLRYPLLLTALVIMLVNPTRGLNITIMDVDQGDGILIRTRSEVILIDGGSTGKKNVGKYSIIPYIKYNGIGVIDEAVITHEDKDHISGVLEIMDDMEKGGIRIKNLVLPDVSERSRGDNYRELEMRAKELGIGLHYISCGQKMRFKDMEFTCLNPYKNMVTEGANAYSTVLFMKYGSFTALFTGDVEEEGQQHLLRDIRANEDLFKNLTMLKVAHHGSQYTTDAEFLKMLSPELAMISCGRDNSYGHPHRELLERLRDAGAKVYRTDEGGAIEINVISNKVSINPYLFR